MYGSTVPNYKVYFSKSERGYVEVSARNETEAEEKFWSGSYGSFATRIERSDTEVGDIEVSKS